MSVSGNEVLQGAILAPQTTDVAGAVKKEGSKPEKRRGWTFGILRDKETDEVPGSVLLLSKYNIHNAPLGLDALHRTSSRTSMHSTSSAEERSLAMFGRQRSHTAEKKKTKDGKIILEPQPEDSKNDPLNWSPFRRDAALLSLGFYCMLGGGMTPILAAGFTNVAESYNVSIPKVALTTGLYMMGLGVGSVIASPTAIAFGKRPVYLMAAILFVVTSIWCALSPNYASLVTARVFMGIAVSPVECLPSATIAEIFFLHERAYRLGVYTLLLLGGKNLVPLVSAAVIQSLGWRWVFWIVAIIVGACFFLLFFFVPETFWDRTPKPHKPKRPSSSFDDHHRTTSPLPIFRRFRSGHEDTIHDTGVVQVGAIRIDSSEKPTNTRHVGFVDDNIAKDERKEPDTPSTAHNESQSPESVIVESPRTQQHESWNLPPPTPTRPSFDENKYTTHFRTQPPKSFLQQLAPFSGRLDHSNWFRVALRPFILYAYPAILWSSAVYALSVGWLIVLSESVSTIYRSPNTYHFSAISAGLVYLSPFIGGILGTAVAGKLSDLLVRYLARLNNGVYEPEFRLVMALPVALSTTIGLMGYGWAAQERDNFWIPTIFFGLISFGCCMGSTTAITFAVDSYRQYAGEALVTLNFSKNIFHGLLFSLFFNEWLDADGPKSVFLALGGIHAFVLLWTVPMYVFGKRARMWTVRRGFMDRF